MGTGVHGGGRLRRRSGQGNGRSKTAPPTRQPQRPQHTGEATVRSQDHGGPGRRHHSHDAPAHPRRDHSEPRAETRLGEYHDHGPLAHRRLLRQRLSRRRRSPADQRPDLAGDAALAQPELGPSGDGQFPRTPLRKRREGRMARPPRRRHVATPRRSDDHRPCQPSSRARRRHLVQSRCRIAS